MILKQPTRPFYARKRNWILASVLLPCLTLAGIWLAGRSNVQSQLAALRAQGLPTTAFEVNDFYKVPDDAADTTQLWLNAIHEVTAISSKETARTLPVVGSGSNVIPPPGDTWDELEASREFLAEASDSLKSVRLAAQAGGVVRFPVDFSDGLNTSLTETQNLRGIARLLILDAHVSAHDGHNGQSLEDLRAVLTLSDALRAEPTIVSQLVRIAIHSHGCKTAEKLMPHCGWSDEELNALQQAVAAANFKQDFRTGLQGERALCLTAMHQLPLGPLYNTNARKVLGVFQATMSGLDQTWMAAIDQSVQLSSKPNGGLTRFTSVGAEMILPALQQAVIAGARAEALRNSLVVAIAIRRQQLSTGELPKSLVDIRPEFLPAHGLMFSIDPFDNRPLRYVVRDSEFVVYSIGRNREDDGGKTDDEQREALDTGLSVARTIETPGLPSQAQSSPGHPQPEDRNP